MWSIVLSGSAGREMAVLQRMAVRVELTSTGRQLELGLVTGVTNTQLVILTLHLSVLLTC